MPSSNLAFLHTIESIGRRLNMNINQLAQLFHHTTYPEDHALDIEPTTTTNTAIICCNKCKKLLPPLEASEAKCSDGYLCKTCTSHSSTNINKFDFIEEVSNA